MALWGECWEWQGGEGVTVIWPQPEAGQVVDGVKWMAKVTGCEEREGG